MTTRMERRRAQRSLVDGRLVAVADVAHGSKCTYVNWACRCAPCTVAWREWTQQRREARRALRVPDEYGYPVTTAAVRHGSYSTYTNWGCRCEDCQWAHYIAPRRQRS